MDEGVDEGGWTRREERGKRKGRRKKEEGEGGWMQKDGRGGIIVKGVGSEAVAHLQ